MDVTYTTLEFPARITVHTVTCEHHTLPSPLGLQWCNRNECSLSWYVQYATDVRLGVKTAQREGLQALKTSVCELWPCLFFISEQSIWMSRHPPDSLFILRMPCNGGAHFPVFVSHADQQFHSAVKNSDWWGDVITLTKAVPWYLGI